MPLFGKPKRKPDDGASDAPGSPAPRTPASPGLSSVFDTGDAELGEDERKQLHAEREAASRLANVTRDYSRRRTLERYLTQVPKHLFLRRLDLKVACCTWNVAEAKPHKVGAMDRWLQLKRGADVIAVALQEVDMGVAAMAGSGARADPWVDYINRQVLPYGFRKVVGEQLVGLVTVIFVKRRLAAEVRHVQTQSVKLGTGGVVGNKGALGVQMTLLCKRFMFINSHFVPHTEAKDKRNENYHYVLNSLSKSMAQPTEQTDDPCTNLVTFGVSGEPSASRSAGTSGFFGSPKHGVTATVSNSLLGYTDYVLWMGDLNYRIETPYEEAMQMIAQQRWPELLSGDQLSMEREAGRTFNDFFEHPIGFAPSYKYVKKQAVYDTSKKGGQRRVPAYCDRVLWYTLHHPRPDDFIPGSNYATGVKYKMYPDEGKCLSDHRPVAALLILACYQPEVQSVERIADMAGLGMPPLQTAAKLSEELRRPRDDEQHLYSRIVQPEPELVGPGTCFTSDEDGEGDEARQRKDIDKRLGRVEELLRKGPLPGDGTLRQLQQGQDVMVQKVDRLKADIEGLRKLGDESGVPAEEINLIGQGMTNVLDRMQSIEGLLAGGALGGGGAGRGMLAAVGRLRSEHLQLQQKMELFTKAVGAAVSGDDISAEEMAPADYGADDDVDEGERLRRADLRQAFLAGYAAGVSSCRHTRRLSDGEEAAQAEALRQRQSALERREDELRALLAQRELDISSREQQLKGREEEAEQRGRALLHLQSQIDERMAAVEALGGAEAAEANLSRREDALAEQELRLMRQRAKLSEQQLRLQQQMADSEAHRDGFSDVLAHREALLGLRESELRRWTEQHARPAIDWPPVLPPDDRPDSPRRRPDSPRRRPDSPRRRPDSPRRRPDEPPSPRAATRHASPEWRGVMDGGGRDRSPSRLRGRAAPQWEPAGYGGAPAETGFGLRPPPLAGAARSDGGPDVGWSPRSPSPLGRSAALSPSAAGLPAATPRDSALLPGETPPPYVRPQARTESPRRAGSSPRRASGSPVWEVPLPPPLQPPPRRRAQQRSRSLDGAERGDAFEAALRAMRLDPAAGWASMPPNFARVGPSPEAAGGYLCTFGTRQLTVRPMGVRRQLRVLIGGGWMPLSDFASKFGPSETRRLARQLSRRGA